MLEESGGSITLTTESAREVLKSLDWVKRRYTTAKRVMNPALHDELTFSWKRKIANAHFEHEIHKKMTFNFGSTGSNKFTFIYIYIHSVSITNVDDKRQITATVCVNIIGDFLPVQLIYEGVTDPKVKFRNGIQKSNFQSHFISPIVKIIDLTRILLWST